MTERKSLSKKIRFEIFKRDSFTCQYCGAKAPDEILEVDHLIPVALGGENDILNLVTSCFSCNRGKSKTLLCDNTIFDKQRKQIEDLNLRRQQLEMLLEWKTEVTSIKGDELEYLCDHVFNLGGRLFNLTDYGKRLISKLLNNFGFEKSLKALELSFDTYFKEGNENEFWVSIEKVGGVASLMDKPDHKKKIGYIIGTLKNRFDDINIPKAGRILNNMFDSTGELYDLEDASHYAKKCTSFRSFCNYLSNFDY